VLLDIMMPGMDGYEVARRIRQEPKNAALPLIFVTAETGPKPLDKFMAAGVVGSLKKPVDPVQLERKLKLFLNLYQQKNRRRGASN